MKEPKEKSKVKSKKKEEKNRKTTESSHLGSSNAFEETENPSSKDPDDLSDERLDEMLDE